MDVGTGLALLGTAHLVGRLLGPTADYVGEGLKAFTERRVNNARRIFAIALRKLGSRVEQQGGISPRVFRTILNEGSFCEDALGAEYFGGLLASSRSESMDDRALPYLRLVQNSSVHDLRMHYLFYTLLRRLFLDVRSIDLGKYLDRSAFRVYIPVSVIVPVLHLERNPAVAAVIDDCTLSLSSHALIDSNWLVGPRESLQGAGAEITEAGVIYRPSHLGSKLFLWVNGHPDAAANDLVSSNLTIEELADIHIPDGAIALGQRQAGG